jgi:hypothetical protein
LGGKIGRRFAYAQQREYPTLLDAVANNVKPRTLDALNAFTIHGDKFATARASHLLVNELRDSSIGKWGVRGSNGIPDDWVEIAPHAHPFQNLVPFTDSEGNPQIARQTLMVPKFVSDALRPITDPDYTARIPWFRRTRLFQSYIKGINLGLSFFHAGVENFMANWNMGPSGWARAWRADRDSPEFQSAERDLILHGGTTSIQGHTQEAYRALEPSSIPSWGDIWRKAPVVREMDQVAQKITDFTFGNLQRRFKVTDYQLQIAKWIADHRSANPAALTAAKQSIAKEVNAVYGGLHWENLGLSRATTEVLRAVMLAPDWSFSNVFNVQYALERGGTPAAKLARMFWARQIVGGLALTQLASLMFTRGKVAPALTDPNAPASDRLRALTQVYMGKDSAGQDIYQNMFFKGAGGDAVNLVNNLVRYGALLGLAHSVVNKLSPIPRVAQRLYMNTNFMGQPIVPKGMNPWAGTARDAMFAVENLSPVPFSAVNLKDMLIGPKANQYTAPEFITTLFAGTPPQHVPPQGMEMTPQGLRQQRPSRYAEYPAWKQAVTGKLRPTRAELQAPAPIQ